MIRQSVFASWMLWSLKTTFFLDPHLILILIFFKKFCSFWFFRFWSKTLCVSRWFGCLQDVGIGVNGSHCVLRATFGSWHFVLGSLARCKKLNSKIAFRGGNCSVVGPAIWPRLSKISWFVIAGRRFSIIVKSRVSCCSSKRCWSIRGGGNKTFFVELWMESVCFM